MERVMVYILRVGGNPMPDCLCLRGEVQNGDGMDISVLEIFWGMRKEIANIPHESGLFLIDLKFLLTNS